ncbi:hypothetical protein ACWOAH_10435 [Vagococcus vulneris]|nr:hypothetical protein [Vagococcus vulneris]
MITLLIVLLFLIYLIFDWYVTLIAFVIACSVGSIAIGIRDMWRG